MDKDRMKCLVQDSQAVSVRFPRIMIAAEKSGGGKTLFTCALLSLLKERVQAVRAFKCGPDYIDPMFHRAVLEIPSRNPFIDDKAERLRPFISTRRITGVSVRSATSQALDRSETPPSP